MDPERHATGAITPLQNSVLEIVSKYQDLCLSQSGIDERQELRAVLALHAMNHVIKQVDIFLSVSYGEADRCLKNPATCPEKQRTPRARIGCLPRRSP
jgi:hypothetical protein